MNTETDASKSPSITIKETVITHIAFYYCHEQPIADSKNLFLNYSFRMPCGHMLSISDDEFYAGEDIPCPCSDPTHWKLKFKHNEAQREHGLDLFLAEPPAVQEPALTNIGGVLTDDKPVVTGIEDDPDYQELLNELEKWKSRAATYEGVRCDLLRTLKECRQAFGEEVDALRSEVERLNVAFLDAIQWRQSLQARADAAEKRAGELEKERDDFKNYIHKIRPKADAYDRVCQSLGIENDILGYVTTLRTRQTSLNWKPVSEPLEDEREEVLVAGGGKGPVVTRLYQRSAIRTHYLRLCDLPLPELAPVDPDLEERKRFMRWRNSFDFSQTHSDNLTEDDNNSMFAAWKAGQQAAAKSSHEA